MYGDDFMYGYEANYDDMSWDAAGNFLLNEKMVFKVVTQNKRKIA